MEWQLAAGLGEREIAEFVEDDDVEASEIVGDASLASGSTFGLELIDEIDGGEEAPARSSADATPRDGDGQMRLACAGPADEDDVALLGDESAAGQIAHESLVDRRILEGEVFDVFGQRQLGDGELIFDRARLFLRDLGLLEIANEPLRLVLALERCGQRLVVGAPHPIELEAAHHVEDFGSFHGSSAPELIVTGAVGGGGVAEPQGIGRQDCRRRSRIALTREDVDDTSAEWTPSDNA